MMEQQREQAEDSAADTAVFRASPQDPAREPTALHLAWDACYNVRDVGNYPTESGRHTRRRALIRADNLHRLTPAGQAALRAYGVRTIIDLRLAAELVMHPNPFAAQQELPDSPRYQHLPLHDLESNAAIEVAEAVEGEYIVILERNKALVAAVINAVAAGLAEGGVVVHCHGGKDRTGIVVALLLALVGVPRATIAADYALSEAQLAAPNADWLEEQHRVQGRPLEKPLWMFTPPEKMVRLLDYLDQTYGGVVGYLAAAGVPETDLAQIQAYLLVPVTDTTGC